MQAVILAAGRGTRMGALTQSMPKPMLMVAGKTLLEHKFDALPEEVDEIILVIGYLGEYIRHTFGGSYKGRRVTYVEQKNIVGGTMDALNAAKSLLRGRFFVMYGDDIYAAEDMRACLAYDDWVILVQHRDSLKSAAKVVLDEHGVVADVIEADSHDGGPGLANVAFYLLDERIFDYPPVKVPGREELGLPQTMVQAVHDVPLHPVEVSFFLAITAPEDLVRAEEVLSERKK